MSDYPLIGKVIESTRNFSLEGCLVDGKIYYSSDLYVPRIAKGQRFVVKSANNNLVTLQNASTDAWSRCELDEADIEDFKVVKRDDL